ncbi:MAG: UDP-glucose 4-epimerase GalE [Oscillospiraceae bacterium]
MSILVTGGTGFIGSHTCVELIKAGKDVVIIDNLCNSKKEVCDKIETISGKKVKFYENDVCDREALERIFTENKIEAVIHFAGLKAVGESVEIPMEYYYNNLVSTLVLCQTMAKFDCKRIVFSSSATVYGSPKTVPIKEDFPLSTTNPYGSTKLMIENILRDVFVSDKDWSIVLLRYFNPIGAHESGLIGENPNGIPNNLMPYISMVASGKLEKLGVFGNDYPTHDGTGVRDYIHVVDLAKGHVKAIDYALKNKGADAFNLGTGTGYSVLDIVKAFEKANNLTVAYEIKPRRAGDIAQCYADPSKSRDILGWQAEFDLERMCKDAWNFAKLNF